MSDQTNATGASTIIPPGSPVNIHLSGGGGQGASPAAAPRDDFNRMSPDQFNQRLEEARLSGAKELKETLKALGVKKEERANIIAQIQAGKLVLAPKPGDGEPDYKSEYEKLKAASADIENLRAVETEYKSLTKSMADDEFAKLPEAAQKFIVAKKLDDPKARLAEIRMLRESGMFSVPTTSAAPTATNPATTMGPNGPNTTPTSVTLTPFQQWQELHKKNPEIAAQFRRANSRAIEASQPK